MVPPLLLLSIFIYNWRMISSRRSSPSTLLHNSPHSHRNWKSVSHHRAWINFYVHVFRRNSHLLTNKFAAACFVHPTVASSSTTGHPHPSNPIFTSQTWWPPSRVTGWITATFTLTYLPQTTYTHINPSELPPTGSRHSVLSCPPPVSPWGLIFCVRCTMDRLLNSGMHF